MKQPLDLVPICKFLKLRNTISRSVRLSQVLELDKKGLVKVLQQIRLKTLGQALTTLKMLIRKILIAKKLPLLKMLIGSLN